MSPQPITASHARNASGRRPLTSLIQLQRDESDLERQTRPLELGLIRRLFTYTAPYAAKRNWLIAIVLVRSVQLPLLVAVMAALIASMARWDEAAILLGADEALRAEHRLVALEALVLGVIGYAALVAFTNITMHFRQRLALELGEAVVHDLRNAIFAHLQRMPLGFFHRTKLGRIISRMGSDVDAVRTGVQDVLFITLVQFGQMVVAAVLMAWYDRVLFLVVLGMAPVIWAITRHFRVKISAATRQVQESFSRVTATLAESVNGIRVTQGFVREDINGGLFRALVHDHGRYNMGVARPSALFNPLLEFNNQLFIAGIVLLGSWRVLHGDRPLEQLDELIRFFFLAALFFGPIGVIGNQYNQALVAMAGAERVFAFLDAPPDWADDPAAHELPPIAGRVEFRHISFGYDPRTPVLHDINFVAEPGQTVALVGHTGSGKSSIINLIAKFYLPTVGELLIDGHEIGAITGASLHRQMGIVLQSNFLFAGTVFDNIRVGRPQATNAEIIEAARTLDCLDLLEALPEGLATRVGERGSGLSLGQRQLVCFTRAILADPRIVILDEATSSVDAMTESRLQKALATLLKGRTSFVVAHRLSTIRHADVVLVLDHGRIIERGTHYELLMLGGTYAELYRQFIETGDD